MTTETSGERVLGRRIVGEKPMWGFDAFGWFFPFESEAHARMAMESWTDATLQSIGGFAIESCPRVEGDAG